MQNEFPSKIPLSGSDYFHLFLDQHSRKNSEIGNIGRFAIKVAGDIKATIITEKLNQDAFPLWIGSLFVKKGFLFSPPFWIIKKETQIRFQEFYIDGEEFMPEEVLNRNISTKNPPLVHLDLVHNLGGTSTIILSWHHALMDAHGAETFFKILGEQILNPDIKNLLPNYGKEKKLLELLNSAREAKQFIVEETPKKTTSLSSSKSSKNPKAQYKTVEFNEEETKKIESRTKELGLRFGLSPLYISATCRSLYSIQKNRNGFEGDFWIPVPQDHRLKGSYGPVVTNQISFLFYKLSEKELTTLKTTIDAISSQMLSLIKEGVTKKYVDMMNLFKRIPLSIYSRMVKGPTNGRLATFFFSDTGDSLRDFNTFLNLPVLDAMHFPPNIHPPGFTIIFMKFKGKLKMVIGYTDSNFSKEEVGRIVSTIKTELLESFA